jgi:hypothetical protein
VPEQPLNTSLLFADKFQYWFFRFLTEQRIRSFFVRRSGSESGAFHYAQNLSKNPRRVIFVPTDLSYLAVHMPLLHELAQKSVSNSLILLCEEDFHPLFKVLGLEKHCLFVRFSTMRFGDPAFQTIESQLRSHKSEVSVMLDPKPSLLMLYLARACGSTYRVGANVASDYPFLNISFSKSQGASPYSFRTSLETIFQVTHDAHPHPLAHNPAQLSSRNVFLLNLEPSVSGKDWSAEELTGLLQRLDPHFRLLALVPDQKLLDRFAPLLDRLAIRTAPIASSYTAFLDLLRQYKGLVTLNSAHAQLAMNVSKIPTLLISEPELTNWIPQDCTSVHTLERGKALPANPFASIAG